MRDTTDSQEAFFKLMALHKYFLNADFLREIFLRRIQGEKSPGALGLAESIDDTIALSLWYATLFVVIEGWRETKLADPDVDALLDDDRVNDLRRFRNQIFHYQREYDNPRLLEFLGTSDEAAHQATIWVRRTHATLGRAIERAIQALADRQANPS